MNFSKFYFFTVLSLLITGLAGCSYFKSQQGSNGQRVLAKVNDEYLYLADLEDLVAGQSEADSLKILSAYTESWVKKKLLLEKAKEYVAADDAGIEKKVESYRESLLLYEYEKELIRQKLDNAIKEEDIIVYYEKNKSNFLLENDAYLINYIVLDDDAEDLEKMKPLFNKAKTEEDERAVAGYCKSFARAYEVEGGVWRSLEAIKGEFGLDDKVGLSVSNNYKEILQGNTIYFLKVKEIRSKGEPTPLDFVRDQIKEMLTNKKKVTLMESIYNKVLEDGLAKKKVEIFVK